MINRLHSFAHTEKYIIRNCVKIASILLFAFMRYLPRLARHVEKILKELFFMSLQ